MHKRNVWRWLVGALVLTLVATAAAGCGSSKKKASSSSTPTSTPTTTGGNSTGGGKTFPLLKVSWLAPDQLDPGLSYTVAGWQVMWNVYLGLLSYKHVGGADGATEIPALAQALPTVTDGGKDFKFTLRSGITYSDGTPVKASDFKCTIERLFKVSSGGVGYFTPIVGAPQFAKTLKGSIPGIITDDAAGTVEFKLSQPNTEFESVLGLPFGAATPCGTPDKTSRRRRSRRPARTCSPSTRPTRASRSSATRTTRRSTAFPRVTPTRSTARSSPTTRSRSTA